jgi:ABC-2 type transport system permease protein
MKIMLRLIYREFGLFWQNKVLVILFFIMSLVLAAVLGFVYKKGKVTGLTILVIDKDHSPSSARLIDMLSEHQTLHIQNASFETVGIDRLLLEKKATAAVVIPYRFEESLLRDQDPEVNCYLNMSNTLKANLARAAIQQCTGTMNAGIQTAFLEEKGVPHSIAVQGYEAFHHNVFLQYNRAGNYFLFLWPGLILGTLQQLLLLATAVGFSQEYANNNFNKNELLKYTRSPVVLIVAKIFPYLCMSFWIIGGDYLLSVYFKMPPPSHPWVLLFSAILFVTGVCMLGTLFSIIFPAPLKTTQSLMSLASPALTISGLTWPAERVPVVLSAIADILPLKPFLKASRLIWIDGASFQQVLPELKHQLLLVTAFSLLSVLLLRKKINKVTS